MERRIAVREASHAFLATVLGLRVRSVHRQRPALLWDPIAASTMRACWRPADGRR
jgi:hypothetical protein